MSKTEIRLWKWAAKVLIVTALLGYLAGQAHLARAKAAREWEERYEAKEWWERRAPNWFEQVTLGLEP